MKVTSKIRSMRLRTKVIACAAVVVVAGGATTFGILGSASSSAAAATVSATVTAATSTLEQTVSGTGTLTPTVDEDVNFAASGNVTAVDVVAGDTVTKGEVLATLDTVTEEANLLAAKATLASAQATLSNSESSSDGSTADKAQIASNQAAVTVAAAGVTTAQTEYDSTTLTAPVSGMVTTVNVAVGDVETAGSSSSASGSSGGTSSAGATSTGTSSTGTSSTGASSSTSSTTSTSTSTSTADFEIVGTDSWDVSVSLSASDLTNVKVGQQVELSTDDNSAFFGTVASIGLLPSTTSGAATYPVLVDVTGSPKDLYDGVTVTADIVYKRYSNVVTVPSAAVTTANGKSTVLKVVDGKNVKTAVTVGVTVDNKTEITKGLSSGDEVSEVIFTPTKGTTGGTTGTRGTTGNTGTTGGTGTFPGGGTGTGGFAGGPGGQSRTGNANG